MKDKLPPVRRDIETVTSWSDADQALGVLRLVEAELAKVGASFDARIQALQEGKASAARPLQEKKERIEALLQQFGATAKRTLPANKKSMQLVHGKIGWRTGKPSLRFVKSKKATIQLLQSRGLTSCLVTKVELDKDAVKKLSPAERELVGVKLEAAERFFYELSSDPVVAYPDAPNAAEEAS